jgi:CubicO group peptidase (beta-lactamase class C family)
VETSQVAAVTVALDSVSSWPAPDVAAAVVAGKGASGWRVLRGREDRRYEWASLTKLLTAYAVLVAVEEAVISLDDPAGPEGATVRHLLSHASGLPGPDWRTNSGTDAPAGRGRVGRHSPLVAPGKRRIYSNLGFEVLAVLIQDRSGMDFSAYLKEAVLEPLGMAGVELQGSAAWGARGTLEDLVRFAAELLDPRLLASETLAEATSVAFPHLSGVLPGFGMMSPNDWGLGFEIRDGKHPHWTGRNNSAATFGHFGQSGCFIWVDPSAEVACMAMANRPFGAWAKLAWPELSDAVLAAL